MCEKLLRLSEQKDYRHTLYITQTQTDAYTRARITRRYAQ
jgi:hypothetical protein